jgi:hypothetical protein
MHDQYATIAGNNHVVEMRYLPKQVKASRMGGLCFKSCKPLILDGWPETGSNRRRRPFQGSLPMELSDLESVDEIGTNEVRAAPN